MNKTGYCEATLGMLAIGSQHISSRESRPETREGLLKGRQYTANSVWNGLTINFWEMSLRIPRTAVDGTRKVTVRAELPAPGTRHENVFAVLAKDDDPASRLAFRVTGRTPSGDEFVAYPRSKGLRTLFHANVMAEWLERH